MDKNCIFCDRTKFEEQIITEDGDYYVIATLGQIKVGYTLIIPKRHVSCVGAMNEKEINDTETLMLTVRDAIEIEYGIRRSIIFEHGIVGQTIQHAHLHILPANIRICGRIYRDFPNSQICFLDSLKLLRWVYNIMGGKKYLLWSTPEGLFKAIIDPPAPPQYLRLVAADLIGHPEYGNWHNMNSEIDKQRWQETVSRLKPYFS